MDKKYLIGAEALPPGNVKVDTVTGEGLNLKADEYQILLESKYVDALGYTNENIINEKIQLVVVDQFKKTEKKFDAKVVGVIAPGVVSMGYSYTNNKLADEYRALAAKEKDVIFGGRLAEYKYYDMDDVIKKALETEI